MQDVVIKDCRKKLILVLPSMILEQVRGLAEKETAVRCFILLFVSFSEPFIHRSRPIQRQPLWNISAVGSGEPRRGGE